MTNQNALRLLEKTLDLAPQTLTGGESLYELESWDSMSTLSFLSMVDKVLGIPLRGNQVARCRTVGDLLALMGVVAAERAA